MSWPPLFELGDLTLTLPLAAAMAAGLLGARDWRAALAWVCLFALALGTVGAAKLAFLGWGTGLPSLDFKAPSGHAAGVSVVFPTLFYLLLRQRNARLGQVDTAVGTAAGAAIHIAAGNAADRAAGTAARFSAGTAAGVAAGILLGAAAAALLVLAGEHSPAEAWAGWLVGTNASLAAIRFAGPAPVARPLAGLACALLAFCGVAWAMQRAQVGYWMIKVALALSGNARPFPWDSCS